LQKKEYKLGTINCFIINTVKDKQPETVEQLAQTVQKKFSIARQEAVKHIIDLNNNGKLALKESSFPTTHKDYLFSTKATWYWITIALALITSITVFAIPENAFPIVYTRYLLGSIFILFLHGYSLIKALFPQKELDNIEKTALSIGMSLAIVPLTGLLLNYTSWGITQTTVTFSLLALTLTFATTAILREQETVARAHENSLSSH